MFLVSKCLLGYIVRYNGKTVKFPYADLLLDLERESKILTVCPELMGGLLVPREPAEILGGDGAEVWGNKAQVMTKSGINVTENFKQGALKVLALARRYQITTAIFMEKSPSCGVNFIYDGSFQGKLIRGRGVTTALLQTRGIKVFSSQDI
ncbi:MAG: DUF523 domain-containing protein [Desulfonauticus sp.]|nr:DUF523 domain-containing protein [Desulfonauticus sp.]